MEITSQSEVPVLEFKRWIQQSIKDAEEKLELSPEQISHILFLILRELDESESR